MSLLIMACLERLQESISSKYIHWCVYDLTLPATAQLLIDLGFSDWANQLTECTDYTSLSRLAVEAGWHIDEERYKLGESITKEQRTLYIRALRSSMFLGQASMNATNIKNTFFSYEIAQAVFAYRLEDKTQEMMNKLQLVCAEAGIDLKALIRSLSE